MSEWKVGLQVDEPFRGQVKPNRLKQVAEKTLFAEGISSPVGLSLVITKDELVRQLNRTYRGVDRSTDVLAFPLEENPSDFPPPPNGIQQLGEVIISGSQARRQAEEQGHELEKELILLIIHGVLHLLGYEDEDPEKEPRMRAREAELFSLASK